MLKVNNGNSRESFEICSKLAIKTSERRHLFHSGVFDVSFEHISHFFLVFLTARIMRFSNEDFFSKCDQIRRNLQIWSHLLKKSLTENFTFCAVSVVNVEQVNAFCIIRIKIIL